MTILGHNGEMLYERDLFLNDHVQRHGAIADAEVISLLGAEPRVEVQFELPFGFSITRPSGEALSLETAVNIANDGQELPDDTLRRVRQTLHGISQAFGDSQHLDGLSTSDGLDDVGRPEWSEER
jgi:hypothetical protein